MDCCICSPMASIFRPPRNSICSSCFEGGRGLIVFLTDLDNVGRRPEPTASTPMTKSAMLSNAFKANSLMGLNNAFSRVKQMREKAEEEEERSCFLAGLVDTMRLGMHTDIVLKPGSSGAPIPAHKALLVSRSEVFRNMLCSDECKAAADDDISFPELSHEELRCLLEFLYTGSLPDHAGSSSTQQKCCRCHSSLLIAADKYDIPFLRKLAERRILTSLGPSNALGVLEVSEMCSSRELKLQAMNSIVDHAEDVLFSPEYEDFAGKNAHLCVEITRALLSKMKDQNEKEQSDENASM